MLNDTDLVLVNDTKTETVTFAQLKEDIGPAGPSPIDPSLTTATLPSSLV